MRTGFQLLGVLALFGGIASAQTLPGDYWARYAAACSGSGTPSAECLAYADRISRQVQQLSTTLGSVAPMQCASETELFLGNGIVIDRASCGPRSGCGAVTTGDQCAAGIPASAQANSASSPLASWCPDCCAQTGPSSSCVARGCMSCAEREDVTSAVASMATQGIAGLRECFSSRYPNRALLQSVMRAYAELGGSTGIRVACPSNRDGNDPSANANASSGQINLFPGAPGVSRSEVGIFAHEFMHLTGRCSAHQRIDNQPTATHNQPNSYYTYTTTPSGLPSPVGEARPYSNRHMDRIYACSNLCFPTSLLSKEECSSCLNFGSSSRGTPSACASMPSLASLEAITVAERERRATEPGCREDYATRLTQDRAQLFSASSSDSATTYSFRGITSRGSSSASECLVRGDQAVEEAVAAALASSSSDARNGDALRFALRKARLDRVRNQMVRACDYLRDVQEAQRQCLATSGLSAEARISVCRSNRAPTAGSHGGIVYLAQRARERVLALREEWNTTAADSAAATDFDGTTIQASPAPENYCSSIPRFGLIISEVITR